MKKQQFFLIVLALLATAACTKKDSADPTFKLDTPFLLDQGDSIPWEDNSAVQVRFNRVLGDSRCPIDSLILCVWAGRAEVEVTFSQPGSVLTDTLVLGDFSGTTKTDLAAFGAYSVRLLQVTPDALANVTIPQEDYVVKLEVKKSQ